VNFSNTESMLRLWLVCSLIAGTAWLGALADDDHGSPHAVAYDLDAFNAQLSLQPHFIMFYAPWFVLSFSLSCMQSLFN